MNSLKKVDLKLDWCSYDAAKYAVTHWHYSKTMPASKTVKIGVWENEIFIGVIIFSPGVNMNLPIKYGVKDTECCELTRVALSTHITPVTRILSIALKLLKKHNPGLKIVISYADENHGHI